MKVRTEGRILRRSDASSTGRSLSAVLSTGVVARDGHIVDPKGWVVPSSGSVPLVDSHRDADGIASVLGRVKDIRVGTASLESGDSIPALLGRLTFAEPEVNPDAETAFQLYRGGYADSVSVSFIPLEYAYADERGRAPGALNIRRAELLEVSTVAVPSDVNAKVLARAVRAHVDGYTTRSDRRVLAQFLKQRGEVEERRAYARELIERIRREDAASRVRGAGYRTVEERRAYARELIERIRREDAANADELRRRLLRFR